MTTLNAIGLTSSLNSSPLRLGVTGDPEVCLTQSRQDAKEFPLPYGDGFVGLHRWK